MPAAQRGWPPDGTEGVRPRGLRKADLRHGAARARAVRVLPQRSACLADSRRRRSERRPGAFRHYRGRAPTGHHRSHGRRRRVDESVDRIRLADDRARSGRPRLARIPARRRSGAGHCRHAVGLFERRRVAAGAGRGPWRDGGVVNRSARRRHGIHVAGRPDKSSGRPSPAQFAHVPRRLRRVAGSCAGHRRRRGRHAGAAVDLRGHAGAHGDCAVRRVRPGRAHDPSRARSCAHAVAVRLRRVARIPHAAGGDSAAGRIARSPDSAGGSARRVLPRHPAGKRTAVGAG